MNSMADNIRITAQVSDPMAEKLQAAADLTGVSLDDFVIQAALEKAGAIIDREETIWYSREDAEWLIGLLDSPAQPNAKLSQAFERYKNKVNDGSLREDTDGDAQDRKFQQRQRHSR